jgi:hypothetical protein
VREPLARSYKAQFVVSLCYRHTHTRLSTRLESASTVTNSILRSSLSSLLDHYDASRVLTPIAEQKPTYSIIRSSFLPIVSKSTSDMSKADSSIGGASLLQQLKMFPAQHLLAMSPDGGCHNGQEWIRQIKIFTLLIGSSKQWVDTFDPEPTPGTEAANRNAAHVFDAKQLYPTWTRTPQQVEVMHREEFKEYRELMTTIEANKLHNQRLEHSDKQTVEFIKQLVQKDTLTFVQSITPELKLAEEAGNPRKYWDLMYAFATNGTNVTAPLKKFYKVVVELRTYQHEPDVPILDYLKEFTIRKTSVMNMIHELVPELDKDIDITALEPYIAYYLAMTLDPEVYGGFQKKISDFANNVAETKNIPKTVVAMFQQAQLAITSTSPGDNAGGSANWGERTPTKVKDKVKDKTKKVKSTELPLSQQCKNPKCSENGRKFHTPANCWITHPELMPKGNVGGAGKAGGGRGGGGGGGKAQTGPKANDKKKKEKSGGADHITGSVLDTHMDMMAATGFQQALDAAEVDQE